MNSASGIAANRSAALPSRSEGPADFAFAARPLENRSVASRFRCAPKTGPRLRDGTNLEFKGRTARANVRFGPLCGLKSDISRGPRSADIVAKVEGCRAQNSWRKHYAASDR